MSHAPLFDEQTVMGMSLGRGAARPYIPRPYPDELGYSVVARAHRRWGVGWVKPDNKLIFGRDDLTATSDLTALLDQAMWGGASHVDAVGESLTWSLTLLPYYTAGMPFAKRLRIVKRVATQGVAGLHAYLGICASPIRVPRFLRACVQCAREDIKVFGEPYWRRAHQLPGVLVCPDHGNPLHNTRIPARPLGRHEFVALDLQVLAEARPEPLDPACLNRASKLAKSLVTLLDYPIDAPLVLDTSALHSELSACGSIRRTSRLERLERDLRAYYPSPILERIDRGVRSSEPIQWVLALRKHPRHVLHPVRYMLVRLVLDNVPRECPELRFGQGPWPCLNWASDHYGAPVITTMEPIRDRRHPGRALGRFHCVCCDMRFTRMHGQSDPGRPYRVIEFGPVFVSQAKELEKAGYCVRAIARLLEVDPKTVKRLLGGAPNSRGGSASNHNRIFQDQAAWRDLVARHPNEGVTALRRREPALYSRLYKRSRNWLLEHGPARVATGSSATRIDWPVRDTQLCERVEQQARDILDERPLCRVTINAIGGRLGCRALLQKKIHLLPKTRSCLSRLCESPYEFRVRRLRDTLDRTPQGTPLSRIMREAAIRSEYATEMFLVEAGLQSWLTCAEALPGAGKP